ncbi:MAG: TlpA family protein disulfide reductase [Gammaproteobacteria bacterium]|nr:TlpA family protein disulfide reductase [Gammaproteobacteria bacterium]MCP5135189.1 TlpA family protein disulfide reductase [Gammaproteobacteria bacterium]
MSIKQQGTRWLLYILLLAVAGFAGFYLQQSQNPAENEAGSQNAVAGNPGFKLPGLDGKTVSSAQFKGKVLVVNFWATWCPPCLREIPLFMDLQKEFGDKGLQFVGIVIDTSEKVQAFADANPFNYPVALATTGGSQLSLAYGNVLGALPFTAVINRDGEVVFTQAGEITRSKADEQILPLL